MRQERLPSAGASYRCSLALPNEALSQNTDFLPCLDERDDPLSNMPTKRKEADQSLLEKEVYRGMNVYPSLSSKSLGIDISSTRSMRLLADSSSNEIDECFRQCSKEGSVRKLPSKASSLITG
jgi:hypothetical protein